MLLKPVAKPMVEFLGELADEVLSPSFVLNVKQKLKEGAEGVQAIVVSQLRDLCVEVELQNQELNGTQQKSRTLTAVTINIFKLNSLNPNVGKMSLFKLFQSE